METNSPISRPKAYLKVRHKTVRTAMSELGLDAVLLTHPPDLAYLTNFTGDDSVGVITEKDFFLVTDFRNKEQADIEAGWLKQTIRPAKMSDALADTLAAARCKRIGFEANFTSFGQVDSLVGSLKALKLAQLPELVPLEDVMVNFRKVKDDHEIDLIRKSVAVAEEAFNAFLSEVKPGQTENHLAGLLMLEMRSRGASDASFPCIVAAGANSSLPHHRPGETLVQQDAPLLIDWGARLKGYCSDLTRTLSLGKVSSKFKHIYNTTLAAQQEAIRFIRPGVTTLQVDRVARDVIEKEGLGQFFGHGLGHGIGRDIHELPTLRKTGGEEPLRPGMIVTVEPGIYLPGEGGVRIEDDVLVTHSGCEVLSSLEKSFEACHIE